MFEYGPNMDMIAINNSGILEWTIEMYEGRYLRVKLADIWNKYLNILEWTKGNIFCFF